MGGYSPRLKDPIHGVLSGVQLGTSPNLYHINGFTKDREVHEATSASQWHRITIYGADPLFATNLDRPIIY